jgi:hypothetical protein
MEAWERLAVNPEFLLLKSVFDHETRIPGDIRDRDSKEDFLYKAIRAKALQEVFSYPGDFLRQARKIESRKESKE